MKKNCIYIEEKNRSKNSNYLFIAKVTTEKNSVVDFRIAAADLYKVFINGESVFYGPSRTAKGYCIENKFSYPLKKGENTIAVLVSSYGVASYYILKQDSFFSISFSIDAKKYDENDFCAYDFKERIKNVQRFSFQRGFVEVYKQNTDFKKLIYDYYRLGEKLPLKNGYTPEIISEIVPISLLKKSVEGKLISQGEFYIDKNKERCKDRSIFQVGDKFEGYYYHELYECLSDTVCSFSYNETDYFRCLNNNRYYIYDFGRNISGLIRLKLSVKKDAEIYVVFDEKLKKGVVDPLHDFSEGNFCCNIIKWSLTPGNYVCEAFEINTLKYLQLIAKSGELIVEKAEVVLVENPAAYSLKVKTDDKVINSIFNAAANTLAQNSFDILTDCPSRERAGWINDFYYSSRAYKNLSCSDNAVNASLLNYILCKQIKTIPNGMVPMCYPSEHIDGQFIPNLALWYILNLVDNLNSPFFTNYRKKALLQIDGIFKYFEKYENEYGLLENLGGWVFIEWSEANSPEFIKGVNFPSNMLYYKALYEAGIFLNSEFYLIKAEKLKKAILAQSFNGEFFEDNIIRNNGEFIRTGNISETCQYFAFFSGVADVKAYKNLYENLLNNFGIYRDVKTVYPHIDKSNIITGLLMRLDLLNEQGEFERAISETKDIFGVMAEKTGTLWEHTGVYASCNHCIAAYSAVVLLRSLLGVMGVKDGCLQLSEKYCKKYDCSAIFNFYGKKVFIKKQYGKILVGE